MGFISIENTKKELKLRKVSRAFSYQVLCVPYTCKSLMGVSVCLRSALQAVPEVRLQKTSAKDEYFKEVIQLIDVC